jgi:hypothetical protein
VNELELLAGLRAEVPTPDSAGVEHAVMTALREQDRHPVAGRRRTQDAGQRRRSSRTRPARTRSRWERPALAGALGLALGAGAFAAVGLAGRQGTPPPSLRQVVVAWSGQPTAPWQARPSYGRAGSATQLVDFATRVAAAPSSPPKPGEWIVVKTEFADSSGGGGGYLFGPPDERKVDLTWYRAGGCEVASVPSVAASLPPARTVTGQLTIDPNDGAVGCTPDSTLGGWKSVSYSYLSSLPSDPAALEQVLLANDPPNGTMTRDDAIYDAIYTLFSAGPSQGLLIPPKLEAALYRVLQQLPGVHFETAADLAGRTGLGFWRIGDGYLKQELVIDPVTYTFMGYEDVAVADHAMVGTDGTRYVKKGHVMGWGAVLGIAIVQKPGQLP